MAEIQVSLTAEEINEAIAKAIVASTLGESIRKMVDEYVKTIGRNSYDNPIRKIVEDEVRGLATRMLEEHRAGLEVAVREQIEGDVAKRLITVAIERLLKTL